MKELIIVPKVSKSKMGAFLAEIKQDGVKTVYADPKNIVGSKMDALWTTKEAKYVIIKNNATKNPAEVTRIKKSALMNFRYDQMRMIEDILQQASCKRTVILSSSLRYTLNLRLLLSQLLWLFAYQSSFVPMYIKPL